jgi:hypothetical protein
MMSRARWKAVIFSFSLAVIVGLGIEALSRITIRLAPVFTGIHIHSRSELLLEQSAFIQALTDSTVLPREVIDRRLGWRYRSGYIDDQDRVNTQGLRGDREYTAAPGPAVTRVAVFGDSFVYATEVGYREAWTSILEELNPAVEVLNYGVGGYGTDQAYLRFLDEGADLRPDYVIIGFAPVNLPRVVNVYRRFLSDRDMPLVKPRFMLQDENTLRLLPNPVPDRDAYIKLLESPHLITRLGMFDYWYNRAQYEGRIHNHSAAVRLASELILRVRRRFLDPDRILDGRSFNTASSAYRIQLLVFRDFSAAIRRSGATPLVVIFPDIQSLHRARAGKPTVYHPLPVHLNDMGLEVIDLADAFLAEDSTLEIGRWFMPGLHYSPEGNRVVAAWLSRQLFP